MMHKGYQRAALNFGQFKLESKGRPDMSDIEPKQTNDNEGYWKAVAPELIRLFVGASLLGVSPVIIMELKNAWLGSGFGDIIFVILAFLTAPIAAVAFTVGSIFILVNNRKKDS